MEDDTTGKNFAEEYEYRMGADGIMNGIILTDYLGSDAEVVIPAEYDGLPVVGLEETFLANESMVAVRIPDSVTKIGIETFAGCTQLASVTIPKSVTSIGVEAFDGCTALTSITIPDSVTDICPSAFGNCTELSSIDVSGGNPAYCSRGGVLFSADATRLVRYPEGNKASDHVIPESVTSIGKEAFAGCISLSGIVIPSSVTAIGAWVFDSCSALSSIVIPGGVTSIGKGVFCGCTALSSITIPDGVTEIGDYAFMDCALLSDITIPAGVTGIGEYAFHCCESLTIHGSPGSCAEKYARNNGIAFSTDPEPAHT